LCYFAKISLVEPAGPVRDIVLRKRMTFEQTKDRADELALKRGVKFAVLDLPPLTAATISIDVPPSSNS
jgi:hypothetical protein